MKSFSPAIRYSLPIALIAIAGLWWFLHRSFNPVGLNQLVFIQKAETSLSNPVTIACAGEWSWSQSGTIRGGGVKNAVSVIEIDHAWPSGTLTIRGSEGTLIAEVEIAPPGRYCGALVLVQTETGDTLVAWNRVPDRAE